MAQLYDTDRCLGPEQPTLNTQIMDKYCTPLLFRDMGDENKNLPKPTIADLRINFDLSVAPVPPDWQGRYRYQPLSTESHHIRLARIVRCDLSSAGYSPYIAVSYTWGGTTAARKFVAIEDSDTGTYLGILQIRKNCYNVLQTIWERDPNKCYWVDSICINQEDVEERNQQVSKMTSVYSLAQSVAVHFEKSASVDIWTRIKALQASTPETRETYLWHVEACLYISIFCSEPFWHRMWIVQELCNARSITFYCYGEALTLDQLKAGCLFLFEHCNLLYEPGAAQSSIDEVTLLLDLACSQRTYRLTDLFFRFGDFECSLSRDRVFALLGMASIQDRERTVVDYDCDRMQLFQDILLEAPSHTNIDFAQCVHNLRRLGACLGFRTIGSPRAWIPARECSLSVVTIPTGEDEELTLCSEETITFPVECEISNFYKDDKISRWQIIFGETDTDSPDNSSSLPTDISTIDFPLGWDESDPRRGDPDETLVYHLTLNAKFSNQAAKGQARATLKPGRRFLTPDRSMAVGIWKRKARLTMKTLDFIRIVLTDLGTNDRAKQAAPVQVQDSDGEITYKLDFREYLRPFREAQGELAIDIQLDFER